jgi:integrase
VKFPKTIQHRKAEATIYGKSANYAFYRVAYNVAGKRRVRSFKAYADAKAEAERVVRELAGGSQASALTDNQSRDALIAFQRLDEFYRATGRKMSLSSAVAEVASAYEKLHGHTLGEAIDGFLSTVAVVKRKQLSEAVNEFIESRKHLSESKDGGRSKHSPKYEHNVKSWLNAFAATFQNTVVSDLTKEHMALYFDKFKDLSAKSRNDRRVTLKMFFAWCVGKDYLSHSHRLLKAVEFKTEDADTADIDFYRPKELRDMLDAADAELVPMLALGGLAGLRREEILRLNWADVWRVPSKIEIGKQIAKGRKRRLVSIGTSLAAWLKPYRNSTGQVWPKTSGELEKAYAALRAELKIPARRNGLRHSFITMFMAQHSDENLCAAEAGNSPQMIHEHYRALATKKEAQAWFGVRPSKVSGNVITLADRKIRA